jgi:hypothetical protein
MPEILVENEPWLGLVVLADKKHPRSSPDYYGIVYPEPGYYGLARADEWHSFSEKVTLWRGPEKREELVRRFNLIEMDCRTVLVDEHGFYTCPPIEDDLKEEVEQAAEKLLNVQADEDAAMIYSHVDDDTSSDFDGEVWIKSEFGDSVAVNEDVIWDKRRRKSARPPRGYVKTERGGFDPSGHEAEIERDRLADPIAAELTKKLKRAIYPETVLEILKKIYPKQYIYWGSSGGDTEVWVSKRALKNYEKKEQEKEEERRLRNTPEYKAREAERRRLEEEERQRAALERQEKIRRGGFPGPKDWSPKGRIPGEA